MFIFSVDRIISGLHYFKFNSDRVESDRLMCLHEVNSVRLSLQSDYKGIILLHVNIASELN